MKWFNTMQQSKQARYTSRKFHRYLHSFHENIPAYFKNSNNLNLQQNNSLQRFNSDERFSVESCVVVINCGHVLNAFCDLSVLFQYPIVSRTSLYS